MAALNPNSLWKFKWEFYLRKEWTNDTFNRLSSVRALVANIDNTANQVEVSADDTWVVFKWYTPTAEIAFEFLENADRDVLNMLFWWASYDVLNTPVSVSNEEVVLNSSVLSELAKSNWDKSKVSSIVVKNSALSTTYVEWDDYEVVVHNWITSLVLIDWWAITSWNTVKVSYSYTANTSEKVEISLDFTEKQNFECKIVAKNPTNENQVRIIHLSSATFDSTYSINFLNVVKAWDITWATMSFKWNEWSVLTFENQII